MTNVPLFLANNVRYIAEFLRKEPCFAAQADVVRDILEELDEAVDKNINHYAQDWRESLPSFDQLVKDLSQPGEFDAEQKAEIKRWYRDACKSIDDKYVCEAQHSALDPSLRQKLHAAASKSVVDSFSKMRIAIAERQWSKSRSKYQKFTEEDITTMLHSMYS